MRCQYIKDCDIRPSALCLLPLTIRIASLRNWPHFCSCPGIVPRQTRGPIVWLLEGPLPILNKLFKDSMYVNSYMWDIYITVRATKRNVCLLKSLLYRVKRIDSYFAGAAGACCGAAGKDCAAGLSVEYGVACCSTGAAFTLLP